MITCLPMQEVTCTRKLPGNCTIKILKIVQKGCYLKYTCNSKSFSTALNMYMCVYTQWFILDCQHTASLCLCLTHSLSETDRQEINWSLKYLDSYSHNNAYKFRTSCIAMYRNVRTPNFFRVMKFSSKGFRVYNVSCATFWQSYSIHCNTCHTEYTCVVIRMRVQIFRDRTIRPAQTTTLIWRKVAAREVIASRGFLPYSKAHKWSYWVRTMKTHLLVHLFCTNFVYIYNS